eukprot:TRINITY_DN36030_c0_g1_i1.p1 TRINITY_DN36030_c0_g1~~TRINITY_DN36030_c0_g1_i1.p1  ORF type:complete len:351 (+),score=81.12 TRINITY_DN36030_c0_g1_i1:36-1088(+)
MAAIPAALALLLGLSFAVLSDAAITFTNVDDVPPAQSLADGFKISLVRPPEEAPNSGQKVLVPQSSMELLSDEERQTLDDYDAIFEKYSLFCNGRWLGVQVLQDSQDLMYLQHIAYMKKPDVIIETGTYKGGLTFFFATILDWIDKEHQELVGTVRDTKILSMDKHHPDMVFAANWFCPACTDCVRAYRQPVWERKVRFIQGLADAQETLQEVAAHLHDLGCLHTVTPDSEQASQPSPFTIDDSKVIMVNLDANHEFDGLMRELIYYAPFVSENSYLIVQDAKLDKIWGTAGPTAALHAFLAMAPEGEFVIEDELKFHAYSQHIYLRRARVTVPHSYFMQRALEALKRSE